MDALTSVTTFLKAIADCTRMKIIKLLQTRPMCVCELTAALRIAQPTVSQHLRRLKAVGLVRERRDGQRVCYSLDEDMFMRHRQALNVLLDARAADIPAMAAELARSASGDPPIRCDGVRP